MLLRVRTVSALASATAIALGGCALAGCSSSCTTIGCLEGINVDFTEARRGTYAVDVVIDGEASTCTTRLPLPADTTASPCTSPDVVLYLAGRTETPAQNQIGGMVIRRQSARTVTIRITRDGIVVREATFTPAYQSRELNGPGCGTCTGARFTLT
ncbi:MAG: uncharacterized protein JWP97_5377 [Labilithrix sp.]|nr:uncharacterized protein [Labilithrix sp.]